MEEDNSIPVEVPSDIDYITQWSGYRIPEGHCIIDKTICGCGFTEFCISDCNPDDVILCSPRKTLLQNKKDQHPEDNVYYYQSEFLKDSFDKIKGKEYVEGSQEYNRLAAEYKAGVLRDHILECRTSGKHCVFMITYDSFHFLKEVLGSSIKQFRVVVDEFQAIFLDSYFKSNVEDEFFDSLNDVPNVAFLSATPMLYKYMRMIDEFMNLPYYKFIWPSSRIEQATIHEKWTSDLVREALSVINTYKERPQNCAFITDHDGKPFFSREAVFYVNSVSMIRRIIRRAELNSSEVNIICADDAENKKKIGSMKGPDGQKFEIGHIPNPMKGETNKMFTFCTKTVYLGADMYSNNARTFVFSDANVKSLSLDIQLDLPQILGRQRMRENPWKNECVVFYKTYKGSDEVTEENFLSLLKKKENKTFALLNSFQWMSNEEKEAWYEKVKAALKNNDTQSDFIRLTRDGGLAYNRFLKIADLRAWEVSRKENRTKVSVIKSLNSITTTTVSSYESPESVLVNELVSTIENTPWFQNRLKLFCEFCEANFNNEEIKNLIYNRFKGYDLLAYYTHFGPSVCRSVSYIEASLKKLLNDQIASENLIQYLLINFKFGEKYTLKSIKSTLKDIYANLGITRTPKATDLEDYFVVKLIRVLDPQTKKQSKGYQIISIR